jgi:fluoride exporter
MKWWTAYLLVGAGGALGAMARMAVATGSRVLLGQNFPWGTFIINISGCFVLGLLATLIATRVIPNAEHIRLAVAIGFLGAYTTFSTYELECDLLMTTGRWVTGLIYMFGSVAAGFAAVRLGVALGR